MQSFILSTFVVLASAQVGQAQLDRSKPYAIVSESGVVGFYLRDEMLGEAKLSVHGQGWAYREQEDATVSERRIAEDAQSRQFTGTLEIPATSDGQMAFRQTVTRTPPNGIGLRYQIDFPQAVSLNSFQAAFTIDPSRLNNQEIVLIGDETRAITIPDALGETQLGQARVSEVRVAPGHAEGFIVKVDQPTSLLVQDNRAWGASAIELRFQFHTDVGAEVGAGTRVERRFEVAYNQPLAVILDENLPDESDEAVDWIPFTLPWDDAPFDFSHLNEKPAGKHGFLTVNGDEFVFADGTPIRFWGVNFSASANFPTHEQSELIARRLAKFGVNIVRTHHADAGWARPNIFEFDRENEKNHTQAFDPESLDRFDYLIHCLKQHGIYIYLDQLVHRQFKPGDDVDAVEELENAAKPYSNFDPRLIELQKKYSHDLWTHVNPYTTLAYKDDPAIVLMEFANENDLFTEQVRLEPYRSRLEAQYRLWATENGVEVRGEKVDFTQATTPILRFLHEVQQSFYVEMRQYLRSIGVKAPMTGSNWSRNLALTSAISINDYTDSHAYWDHPSDRYTRFHNRPMVASPRNIFPSLTFNRVIGKPFFVSEWDQPFPNAWRAEMSLAMAAVAAFQGWNGLTAYTYRHNTAVPVDRITGAFDQFNDPARFGLFYHAALIFRRGDVQPAKQSVAVYFSPEEIFAAPNPGVWGMQVFNGLPEKHRVAVALDKRPEGVEHVLTRNDQTIDGESMESDTGELKRRWKDRIGVIDTARTKVAYGFLGDIGELSLRGLTYNVKTGFATIALSSLTDEPIAQSSRLLLTAVGRAQNTGFKTNITRTRKLEDGHGPILVEPIEARISLVTDRAKLEVWAMGVDGERIRQMPSTLAEGRLTFEIGREGQTIYYLMEDPSETERR